MQHYIRTMNRLRFQFRRSRVFITSLGMVLVIILGAADYVTGPEVSFSIFYLIPITAVSWFVGPAAGVLTSMLAAIAFLMAILFEQMEYSHPSIPYWNALVRLGLFLIVTMTLVALRRSRNQREELSQFVIHDLRSPLTNVMTGLEILREDEDEKLDAEQRSFVEMCLVSCTRMLTLVNSLLDLSRLERGRMPLRCENVQAAAVCTSAVDQVRLWARQTGVRLDLVISENATVVADPELTVRVLMNLLSNAVKHAPEASTVTLRVEVQDALFFAFSVQDEGSGIPHEWAEKVFDAYAQVDVGRSAVGDGSGLGLAFSKKAIQAQGGQIWMESAPDAGTVVTFTLPRSPGPIGFSDGALVTEGKGIQS